MSAAPTYASTPVTWCALAPGTADTSWTGPTAVNVLGSAGTLGTKISQMDVIPSGTTVTGLVNVFLYDGTAYHLHEPVQITAGTTTATIAPVKTSYTYDNLVLPSGWSMRITTTVAGNENRVEVNAFGASF